MNRGKVESCSRMRDGNRRLGLWEDEVRKIWEDILRIYINTQEQATIHMCGFDGVQSGNY